MIISQTPFRVSFFGGGTDYPLWYQKNGGFVLSTTIDKFCYLSCRYLPPFFEHRHRLVYSRIESVKSYSEIEHPSAREVLKFMAIEKGLEIHHDADLPARSGIGSSSAFTVGLLNVLFALKGQLCSKRRLADMALHLEQKVLQETVGSQDQIAAAFGGFNLIQFNQDGTYDVRPILMASERKVELQQNLMFFFTGFSRIADKVAKSKVDNFSAKEAEINRIKELATEALSIFETPTANMSQIGSLLHESWISKKSLSTLVSNPALDDIYENAIAAGALGGKIIGAGGGGFILLYVEPKFQASVRKRLHKLIEVPFKFESRGSHISLYEPDLTEMSSRPLLNSDNLVNFPK